VLALVMMFTPSAGLAQLDQAISDASLTDPWDLQKAVVLSLPGGSSALDKPQVRSQLDATLRNLDEGLAGFESQVLTFIERLVGDPQYSYVAAENSAEMSAQIAGIEKNFGSLYAAFALEQRTDVRAAQASLGTLKSTLAQKTPFEHDVNRALGSGSRQEILSFATRWWTATEHAIAVRKAVADLKQRLDASTPAH
jgi:ATP-dependent exoDNAse (exonuclease V) beta subunit